jgi:osmotically-inducible protein OsmY
MKNYVNKIALFVALSCGFALAQSMPQQQSPQTPATPSASQPAQDQTQPAAQPDQSTDQGKNPANAPENMPKSDQDKNSKMPQSDAAAAGGDVQSQVQTAIQQDPKLANANITVEVKGKNLELNGTVPSGDEKKQAEKIAKSNAGSLKVKNHIKVASNSMGGQDKDKNPGAPPKQ